MAKIDYTFFTEFLYSKLNSIFNIDFWAKNSQLWKFKPCDFDKIFLRL